MANKCLVTELKGVVDNPNLPYLGELNVEIIPQNAGNDKLVILSAIDVNWKCDKTVYNAAPSSPGRTSLGNSGTALANTRTLLYVDEKAIFRVYPMYDITELGLGAAVFGQLNLDDLVLNGNTLAIQNTGNGFYGHLSECGFNINLTPLSGYEAFLPFSTDMEGYDKLTFNPVSNERVSMNFWQGSKTWIEGYRDPDLENAVEDGADICGILDGVNVPQNLYRVSIPQSNKMSISDIELFSYDRCPRLAQFAVYQVNGFGGDLIAAFKDNPNFIRVVIKMPNDYQSTIELSSLFDGWKSAGKKSSNCSFYIDQRYTVNGENLPTGTYQVIFDANGDWTVS